MIALWQAADPANAVAFDRTNIIGLHFLALLVNSRLALDVLHAHLDATVEASNAFAPEPLRGGPVRDMMRDIPGGVHIEFIATAT